MKVYIITYVPFPYGMAAANRVKCYAKAIKSQGVEVEIVIYLRTVKYGCLPKNTQINGVFDGVPYKNIAGTLLRKKNFVLRRWHDYADRYRCLQYLKSNLHRNDVIFAYNDADVDFTIKLIKVAHSRQAKFVRDLCELPYGTGAETFWAKRNREKVVKLQAPICDGYVCISKALFDYISPYTNPKANNIIVPILVDFRQYELPDLSSHAQFPYIFHCGTLTEQKDGVSGMLEAFGMACEFLPPSCKFILTGDLEKAKAVSRIKFILQKYQITERVIFTGYLSDDELRKYLSEASLAIVNKYVTQQNIYCFSTKLGEYLAAGKPVIITNIGEAMNWLKDGETAYIVEPENIQQLSQAIIDVFTYQNKRASISSAGRELCRRSFDYRQWGGTLVRYFNEIIEN